VWPPEAEILRAVFNLTDVISSPELKGVVCKHQFWGRDVNLRRNMMTSAWMDVYNMINSNDLKLKGADGKPIKAEVILKFLDQMTGTTNTNSSIDSNSKYVC
jgi:hypothetical protein